VALPILLIQRFQAGWRTSLVVLHWTEGREAPDELAVRIGTRQDHIVFWPKHHHPMDGFVENST
jgi:hypothetical protein